MKHTVRRGAVPATALACAIAAIAMPLQAQVEVRTGDVRISIGGRLHSQFNTTSVAGEPSSDFLIRRARLEFGIRVNEFLSGAVQPDFGEGGISLKDAYVQLAFSPQFELRLGQFKRPFDLFELTSSSQTLVIERDGDVRGLSACSGAGGVCSLSRLTERLRYADRDIGVMAEGASRNGRVSYMAAITNGAGANTPDENGSKSLSGRVEVAARPDVRLAVNLGLHDYLRGPDDEYALAFGADIEYGDYDGGLHVQGGIVFGDNWRNLVGGSPSTFATFQGIVSYRTPVRGRRITAIEPLGRLSWGDPDTDAGNDAGLLFTPGVVIHFTGRNKIAANLDIVSPGVGDTEMSLKMQSYLYF